MSKENTIKCICCFSEKHTIQYRKLKSVYNLEVKEYSLEKCLRCGNLRTVPVPHTDELKEIYSTIYHYDLHEIILGEKKFRANGLIRMIDSITPAPVKILEVGCSIGFLLEKLKSRYEVFGIDFDEAAIQQCRQRGVDAVRDSIEHFTETTDRKFDLIIMSHVLEHIENPVEILNLFHRILNKDGQLLILGPNAASFSTKIFGKFWGWWQVPVHLNHFNSGSLKALMLRCGFQITKLKKRGGDSTFLVLCFMNIFGVNKAGNKLTPLKKVLLKVTSVMLRYWCYVSNEEIVIMARENKIN